MSLLRIKPLVIILLILLFLVPSKTSPAGEALVLSVHPYLPATEISKRFSPLVYYLGMAIDTPITLLVARRYDEHIELIGNNKVDIAYMGPSSYVIVTARHGTKPLLARLEINGKPFFHGAIIVRKESKLKSLEGLAGKRFAFGDIESTMSHLVPRYMLIEKGISNEKLAGFTHLENHNNVALNVLSGTFDAGAVKEEVFNKYKDRGLRVIAWTPEISEHLFITSNTLSPENIAALRKAMYSLNDTRKGRDIMAGIKSTMTGMVPAEDRDYDLLRAIMQTLKKEGVLK
jgi:phosphonate transport system substrate-binding protein